MTLENRMRLAFEKAILLDEKDIEKYLDEIRTLEERFQIVCERLKKYEPEIPLCIDTKSKDI
jgi:hypothetical protein